MERIRVVHTRFRIQVGFGIDERREVYAHRFCVAQILEVDVDNLRLTNVQRKGQFHEAVADVGRIPEVDVGALFHYGPFVLVVGNYRAFFYPTFRFHRVVIHVGVRTDIRHEIVGKPARCKLAVVRVVA